ncbi:hypothetical protein EDD85DRAFT_786403 [Armillaria nabsnona]|nr:hypothetical protein EDD85DRAFT_786403 [Armillaria nabsnona]
MCTVYNNSIKGIRAARYFAVISISKPKVQPTSRTILQGNPEIRRKTILATIFWNPVLAQNRLFWEYLRRTDTDSVIGWTFDSYIWLQVLSPKQDDIMGGSSEDSTPFYRPILKRISENIHHPHMNIKRQSDRYGGAYLVLSWKFTSLLHALLTISGDFSMPFTLTTEDPSRALNFTYGRPPRRMFELEEVRLQFYLSQYCTNKLLAEPLINRQVDVTAIPKL